MGKKDPDAFIDITPAVCPMTFVKAKVAIEKLESGQILEIRLNEGEPLQNVPRSLKEEGHKVLEVTKKEDGSYTLLVERDGL